MLDVIHVLFEQDMSASSPEEAEAKSKLRESIYRDMYGTVYKYKYTAPKDKTSSNKTKIEDYEIADEDFADLDPFNPNQKPSMERKPTMDESTITQYDLDDADPFGGLLEPPMSHN